MKTVRFVNPFHSKRVYRASGKSALKFEATSTPLRVCMSLEPFIDVFVRFLGALEGPPKYT